MPTFKKPLAAAKAKIAKAEAAAFMARLEAIDAILDGAKPSDIMLLAAHALAGVAPLCCDQHQDEFKADFLRMLADCIAAEQEQEDAADAEEDSNAPPHLRPRQHERPDRHDGAAAGGLLLGRARPEPARDRLFGARGVVAGGRAEAVAAGGGDRRQQRPVFKPRLAPVA